MLAALEILGKNATIAELAGATTALEKLAVLGAISASFYVGAVIGSIAVASGRSLACGASIADFLLSISQRNLGFKGWRSFYAGNPQVLDRNYPFRNSFAVKAKISRQFEYV